MENTIWLIIRAGFAKEVALCRKDAEDVYFIDFSGEMTDWIKERMPPLIHYACNIHEIDEYDARGATLTDAEVMHFMIRFAGENKDDKGIYRCNDREDWWTDFDWSRGPSEMMARSEG